MIKKLLVVFLLINLNFCFSIFADVEPIKGKFSVVKVEKTKSSQLIEFESHPDQKIIVKLYSEAIPNIFNKGQIFDLVVYPASRDEKIVDAAQILAFLPSENGSRPLIILSVNNKKIDLKDVSLLKMHDPESDYRLF